MDPAEPPQGPLRVGRPAGPWRVAVECGREAMTRALYFTATETYESGQHIACQYERDPACGLFQFYWPRTSLTMLAAVT
jgi:hypothetical protein